jgi:hypothetical protein
MKLLSSLVAVAAFALASVSGIAADAPHEDGCCAPQKAAAPAKGVAKAAAKQTYTCPMHPEVTSDKAGKCPECGMDLVLKKPEGKKK